MSVATDRWRNKIKKKYVVYNGHYWTLTPCENYAEVTSFCKQRGIKIIKALPHGEWVEEL